MFKSSSIFDKLLDKATSLSNLEPDWASILQICDSIRQNDIQPKYALGAIKKKLYVTNPNVVLMTLQVLESCMKNCGSVFHNEVATKQFMDDLHDVLKQSSDVNVRDSILRIVQVMSHAFRNEPSYRAVSDKMKVMKNEGYQFPALKESDAMFTADAAPEWADGECCHRCRVQFTMVLRKHHCRHCGQVFCAKCSAKTSTIPKFGIEKEVRVCDLCFDKINSKTEVKHLPSEEPQAKPTATSTAPTSNKKTEQEIQEEEELQLAIALSKSEAENLERERVRFAQYSIPKTVTSNSSSSSNSTGKHKKSSKSKASKSASSSIKKQSSTKLEPENEDPELARYLNREYWESRSNVFTDYEPSPSPSAPQPSLTSLQKVSTGDVVETKVFKENLNTAPNDNHELESFTNSLRSTIEIFVNRLNSNKLRGRPITNDNGVQSLFMNLTNLHTQLIMHTQQTNEARTNCERLQDKISQIRDARAALDALREEHRDQMRQAAEEAERIRQQQMAQKLEIMRKKKQEYLQYQREVALQRMQEQELMIRNEQFKFVNANVPVASPVIAPQWHNAATSSPVAAGGYYVANQNYAIHAPIASMAPQAEVMNGQYVQQSTLSNNVNMMVAGPHQPSIALPGQVAGQLPPQVMPTQYAAPIASMPVNNMYLQTTTSTAAPTHGTTVNYSQDALQNAQIPPAEYSMMAPPAPPAAPPQPLASEANEELLIKFD